MAQRGGKVPGFEAEAALGSLRHDYMVLADQAEAKEMSIVPARKCHTIVTYVRDKETGEFFRVFSRWCK